MLESTQKTTRFVFLQTFYGGGTYATRTFATPIFVTSATPIFVTSATPYFRTSATRTHATPKILSLFFICLNVSKWQILAWRWSWMGSWTCRLTRKSRWWCSWMGWWTSRFTRKSTRWYFSERKSVFLTEIFKILNTTTTWTWTWTSPTTLTCMWRRTTTTTWTRRRRRTTT